jgi:hypothetical protein
MKTGFHMWLRQQVERLEVEIRSSDVFDTEAVPTSEQLMELRRLAVVHRYLVGQIEKMPPPRAERPLDRRNTQEIDVRQYVSV